MSARYQVLRYVKYDQSLHNVRTVSYAGQCGLHGCGEPAVLSMEVLHGECPIWLGVCARGEKEYESRLASLRAMTTTPVSGTRSMTEVDASS